MLCLRKSKALLSLGFLLVLVAILGFQNTGYAQVGSVAGKSTKMKGLTFKRTNIVRIKESASQASSVNQGGSALRAVSGINTNAIRSEVVSNINPLKKISEDEYQANISGDRLAWNQLARLHEFKKPNKPLPVDSYKISTSYGQMDSELISFLLQNPEYWEVLKEGDLSSPPTSQLTSEYHQLIGKLNSVSPDSGQPLTRGGHVVNVAKVETIKDPGYSKVPSYPSKTRYFRYWFNNKENITSLDYQEHGKDDSWSLRPAEPLKDGCTIELNCDGSFSAGTRFHQDSSNAGSTNSTIQVTINGFGQSLNPFAESAAFITANSSSSASVGAIRPDGDQSIEELAEQYGTTPEAILKFNNLTEGDSDSKSIAGIELQVPSSTQTLGAVDGGGFTLAQIAEAFDVSLEWLQSLNDYPPGTVLEAGQEVKVPGLASLTSSAEQAQTEELDPVLAAILNLPVQVPSSTQTLGAVDGGGFTLAQIAQAFDVSLEWLQSLNDYPPGTVLEAGQEVKVPGLASLTSSAEQAQTEELDPVLAAILNLPVMETTPPSIPEELEYIDYGAYTTIEKVYEVEKITTPLNVINRTPSKLF